MARAKRPIKYDLLTKAEMAWLVQVDDCSVCFQLLYEYLVPIAQRIAGNYARRYTWLDKEDISQDMLDAETIRRIICGYRPGKETSFEKYAYFRLTFEAKDVLRKEDPLGISWPQKGKGHYPEWHRLGDEAFSGFDVAGRSDLTDEDREFLAFVDSVESLRSYFASRKPLAKRRFAGIVSNPIATAWTKESGFQVVATSKRLTIRRWRKMQSIARKQQFAPKQLGLFDEVHDG